MKRSPSHPGPRLLRANGFTLVELLVSMTVLVLLVVMVAQLMNGTTATTTNSRKHMDADSQARMIFDRIGDDLGKMVKRKDVDYIFYKNATGTGGVNDAMFFYSEAPSYYDSTSISGSTQLQSTVALVGYRMNSQNRYYPGMAVLERLGKGLTWDGILSGTTTPGGPVYLTTGSNATPLAATLLDGNWTSIGTAANNYTDGTDQDYHVLSDQAFRLEIAFLLNDGTTSTIPATNPGTVTNNLSASVPPTVSSDSASNFAPGSRWFDTSAGRGYICASATPGAAVWNPIGIQDVSAVIVAIAILDTNSRKIVSNTGKMVSALADPGTSGSAQLSTTQTMAYTWTAAVNSGTFAAGSGIPQSAASQVRIYQRYFYLNNK